MDKNLTVQEALTKLLAEKKSLLNDSKTLVAKLNEHVAPAHFNKIALFRKALLETNINEILMAADGLGQDARAKAETESVARLQEVHMTKKNALFVVQTLTEAMSRNREQTDDNPIKKLKFIPVTPQNPPQGKSSQEKSPQDKPLQEKSSQDNSSQDNSSQDNSSQDNSSQDNSSQDNSSQDNSSQDNSSQDNSSQDNSSQDNSSQDNSSQDNSSQDNSSQDNSSQDNSSQDNSSQSFSSKKILIVVLVVLAIIGGVMASDSSNSSSKEESQSTDLSEPEPVYSLPKESDLSLSIYDANKLWLDIVSIGMSTDNLRIEESPESYTDRLPGYVINEYSNIKTCTKDGVICALYSDDSNLETTRGIHPGTPEKEIEKAYGSPYKINNIDASSKAYIYEFKSDDGTPCFLSFVVNDGKVKYIEIATQPLTDLVGAIMLLQYFHEKITEHDFEAAYACFGDNMKRQFSDYKKWTGGYKNTVKSEIIEVNDADQSKKNKITLHYVLKAVDNPGGERLFNERITFVKEGDHFKIDDIENEATLSANPFSDVPAGHWAYQAVKTLAAKGINQGYGDGTFRGDRNITRYETATMLAKILMSKSSHSVSKAVNFSDVPSGHWAHDSVSRLSAAGISQGYNDGSFRGDKNITRYEMAVMVSKLISNNGNTTGAMPFSDVPAGHWASKFVKTLATKGINEGYGDGTFRGDRNITRYEAAMMLAKALVSM